MNTIKHKPVSQNRLQQLLESYGSEPSCWPEEEREAAINLLAGSPELKNLQAEASVLDGVLARLDARDSARINSSTVQNLQQQILDRLPEKNNGETTNTTHHKAQRARLWASIAASIVIAAVSFSLLQPVAVEHPATGEQSSDNSADAFAQWAWEDITEEPLSIDTDNDPSTLMALVELELLQ